MNWEFYTEDTESTEDAEKREKKVEGATRFTARCAL
jgi:hypothetical protein